MVKLNTADVKRNAILFFFSSRRRHTRYWRDWSSDVCSSDLVAKQCCLYDPARSESNDPVHSTLHKRSRHLRSEERRVGKSVEFGSRVLIEKKQIKIWRDSRVKGLNSAIASRRVKTIRLRRRR